MIEERAISLERFSPNPPAKLPEDLRAWAREMRGKMTDAEALVWRLVRNRGIAGMKFRRQHPMGRYILDFYCTEKSSPSNWMAGSMRKPLITISTETHGCENKEFRCCGSGTIRCWQKPRL